MKCLFSIVFVYKLSIRDVALSSLYSKLPFSPREDEGDREGIPHKHTIS